ncbi:MAG TPA: metalloprotease PmbA [Verrucomicrobiae bacterium]|nr:metalloprotease PmbA [Verrucomicrobiae bacterium]
MTDAAARFELPDAAVLEPWVRRALDAAAKGGATQAEATVSVSRGLSLSVRKGDVESVEFHHDRDLGLTVYFGQRSGSASTADLSERGLAEAVAAACAIAKASGEDPCSGLADANRMAQGPFPDLDLDHPWAVTTDEAIDLARQCEAAALAVKGVTQSEGASLHSSRGIELYANTHGFLGARTGANHYVSCAAIAGEGETMQRDDWYTSARHPGDLEAPAAVGRRAGERAIARVGAKAITTRKAPVLYVPDLARSLFGHFLGAISGGSLYRKASFLLDRENTPVFAPGVRLTQHPFIKRGSGSASYDQEGVATFNRVMVDDGVLKGYVLGSYSARKLGRETTGNAGGVYNLVVEPGTRSFEELLALMGEGLVVTELMGQGVSTVTGDYSRGAAGFWVANGRIAQPVQEVTIAGNLDEMFRSIKAIGADVDTRGSIRTGSVLIEPMTIAGK